MPGTLIPLAGRLQYQGGYLGEGKANSYPGGPWLVGVGTVDPVGLFPFNQAGAFTSPEQTAVVGPSG